MVVSEGEGGVSGRVGEPGEVSRGAAPVGYESEPTTIAPQPPVRNRHTAMFVTGAAPK